MNELSAAMQARSIRRQVADYTKREEGVYRSMYAAVGLSEAQSLEALKWVAKIHETERAITDGLTDLAAERQKYDEQMRKALTPELYAKYRELEARKGAQFQAKEVVNYLNEQKLNFTEGDEVLINAIQKSNALLAHPTHGPYDGVPQVPIGNEQVKRAMSDEVQSLEASMKTLLSALSGKIDDNVLEKIERYYTDRLEYLRAGITKIPGNGP